MRKLIVAEFVSLDGVMEDPGGAEGYEYGGWTMPYWGDDIGKFKFDEMFEFDVALLGRVTYEAFARAWPSQTGEFADRLNGMHKYVVSNTIEKGDWGETTVLKDIPADVAKLRETDGVGIGVAGSAMLVKALVEHDLVDELRLIVYPVVLGRGKRLFGDPAGMKKFRLKSTQPFESGAVALVYERGE